MRVIAIDRLALHLSHLGPDESRRLADRIAEGLSSALGDVAEGDIPSLRLDLQPLPGEGEDRLSALIVDSLARAMGGGAANAG